MDDYYRFFDLSKPLKKTIIHSGTTQGRVVVPVDPQPPRNTRKDQMNMENLEKDVEEMRKKVQTALKIKSDNHNNNHEGNGVGDEIYEKYYFGHRSETTSILPINNESIKADLLSKLKEYPVIVVDGHTGCGKSTQVKGLFSLFFDCKNSFFSFGKIIYSV